ncbi:TetR family transcriptional regulator [Streptomyces sp. TRM43335]|uniref:TetR family transcriptional regulator n=1 Tax=Streptomyces taklimakanensis TaxID=2569853 RepID=A0A6G2BKA0_9ACTN|nr:TetR/AcrR family transcriptional regulator [Streptomyces taklimakanensis]MTE22322.1 TetR family transcriptional regulator [Streptomyces taklimakanensis]
MSPRPRNFDLDHALDAAMATFWDKGYAATSAQDLVESTGLGRGSLYNAFHSKHDLFEAAIERYDAEWTTRLVALLEEGPGLARDRIRAVLMSVVEEETAEAPEHRGCLVVNTAMELAGRDPRVTELVRRTFARMEAALTACVEQGWRDGSIEETAASRSLALHLLNSLYGLRVLGKVADRETLVGVVDRALPPLP